LGASLVLPHVQIELARLKVMVEWPEVERTVNCTTGLSYRGQKHKKKNNRSPKYE